MCASFGLLTFDTQLQLHRQKAIRPLKYQLLHFSRKVHRAKICIRRCFTTSLSHFHSMVNKFTIEKWCKKNNNLGGLNSFLWRQIGVGFQMGHPPTNSSPKSDKFQLSASFLELNSGHCEHCANTVAAQWNKKPTKKSSCVRQYQETGQPGLTVRGLRVHTQPWRRGSCGCWIVLLVSARLLLWPVGAQVTIACLTITTRVPFDQKEQTVKANVSKKRMTKNNFQFSEYWWAHCYVILWLSTFLMHSCWNFSFWQVGQKERKVELELYHCCPCFVLTAIQEAAVPLW